MNLNLNALHISPQTPKCVTLLAMSIELGRTVEFHLTFTGVVVKTSDTYISVRTKRGTYVVLRSDIVRVLDPQPDKHVVIDETACPKCFAPKASICRHLQNGRGLRNPHAERINLWITQTGWDSDSEPVAR